jgi:hypothetical protein
LCGNTSCDILMLLRQIIWSLRLRTLHLLSTHGRN